MENNDKKSGSEESISQAEIEINSQITEIDRLINLQLNEILHHPEFQHLEASWRGLHYLINETQPNQHLKIKVFQVWKKELLKDFERSIEFDQSTLFKRVCDDIYSTFGEDPFGLLIGDYEFNNNFQDIALLEHISQVAATAHAPFISAASPAMFGWDNFSEMYEINYVSRIFDQVQYTKWRSFRDSEASRYVGLCLPHILLREPYLQTSGGLFNFQESVLPESALAGFWGNAGYAFGSCVAKAYRESGWCAMMSGPESDGLVEGLGSYSSPDVKEIDKPRQSIDYLIEARHAEGLSEMGFIPLIQNLTWIEPSFFSDQSCSKPKQYDSEAANKYARSTTKLPYIFAISRFAHYLKVIVRDRSQPFTDGQECQNYLNRWVQQYVPNTFEDRNSFRCPLRECRIEIAEEALAEDEFKAVVFLLPTYQFEVEDLRIALRMVVDLPTNQRNSTVTTYDLKEITAKSEPTTKPGIAQIDELFKLQIKEMSEEVLCDLGEIGGLYSIDGRVTLRRLKQKSPRNFVCSLDDEFLDHHHEFYLALLSPEPAERVQRTTKLSSPETIQTVVERALPGVTLKHIFTGIFQYFLLETEDNAYWNLIKQAKNMAVNVWPELIFAEPILLGVPKVLPKKTRSLFENQILNFLNEPSLDVEDAGNNVHSYRFFWKPGPVDNRLFRVNIEADQTGSIVVKDYRISIQAGQLEIHWIKNETFPLTSEEIVWWLKLLERCRFWEIEDEPPRQGRMEGACWTIEGLKYGHQHEFFRLTPREPDIRELGLAFLRLARFKIDENYFF